jgi:hypothetical protein
MQLCLPSRFGLFSLKFKVKRNSIVELGKENFIRLKSFAKRGSAAARLLGLRVRIPPRVWMFVLCVLYSKGQKAKPGQSGQRSTDKVQRAKKKKHPAWDMELCLL